MSKAPYDFANAFNSWSEEDRKPTSFFVELGSCPTLLQELDDFRREYELMHGKTDPSIQYTTQKSVYDQELMDRLELFEGSPPFVKAYLQNVWSDLAADGRLDDVDSRTIEMIAKLSKQHRHTDPDLGNG